MWSPVQQNNYLQCTVQRDNDFLKVVVDVLAKYFFNVILPETVSRKRDEDFQRRKQCCFQKSGFSIDKMARLVKRS